MHDYILSFGNYLPYLDKDDKFIAFMNNKVASSSFVNALSTRIIHLRSVGFNDYKEKLFSYSSADLNSIFKFTIVRNPYDRVVSSFFFLRDRLKLLSPALTFEAFILNGIDVFDLNLNDSKNNDDFCVISNHLAYQSLRDRHVDFVGRLENIDSDWAYISRKIDCSVDFPINNKTVRQDYRTYYNEKLIDRVSEIYKCDIEKYNYSF